MLTVSILRKYLTKSAQNLFLEPFQVDMGRGLETVSTVTTGDYERRKRAFRQAVREWRYGSAKKNLRPWHPVNVAKRAAPDATGMNLAVEA